MTNDTTSVDALRTRLARAFEVAALRDPSAELAAFEAAVRHDQGERIAKLAEGQARLCARKAGKAADGGDDIAQAVWMHRQEAHETDAHIARNAADLSPPP